MEMFCRKLTWSGAILRVALRFVCELGSGVTPIRCPSQKVHPAQRAGVQMLKIHRLIPDKAGGAAIRRLASRQRAGNRRDVSSEWVRCCVRAA